MTAPELLRNLHALRDRLSAEPGEPASRTLRGEPVNESPAARLALVDRAIEALAAELAEAAAPLPPESEAYANAGSRAH